jgi:hypothetical protein
MNYVYKACFAILFASTALICATRSGTAAGDKEQDVKDVYKKLIDAENRHDLPAVREFVWNSPSTLFVAKAPVGWHGYWGIDDVMQHLHDMYQQPFRIDHLRRREGRLSHTGNCGDVRARTDHRGVWRPEPGPQAVRHGVDLDQDPSGMEDDDRHSNPRAARASRSLSLLEGVFVRQEFRHINWNSEDDGGIAQGFEDYQQGVGGVPGRFSTDAG